jgi:ligand-binding SRPBCC domain-containing protein
MGMLLMYNNLASKIYGSARQIYINVLKEVHPKHFGMFAVSARIMATHTLKRIQRLPISLEQAWDYFSSPENLKNITPEYMDFKTTSDPDFLRQMYAGQIITYTVKPIFNIPLYWMTEIKHVERHKFFVDEQRVGPYNLWHHQHHFKSISGGVEMTDLVHYRLPLGFLGDFAHVLFVKNQLKEIFDYRWNKLEEIFGKYPG